MVTNTEYLDYVEGKGLNLRNWGGGRNTTQPLRAEQIWKKQLSTIIHFSVPTTSAVQQQAQNKLSTEPSLRATAAAAAAQNESGPKGKMTE